MHESLKMLTGIPNACGVLWDIPTVLTRTLRFGDKGKWQNLSSTLATQSAFRFKHRPVIVTNILCGSGSSFFHIFSSVFAGNSTMNTTKNKYSQHGQVYGRLHHPAVQSEKKKVREYKLTHIPEQQCVQVSALETSNSPQKLQKLRLTLILLVYNIKLSFILRMCNHLRSHFPSQVPSGGVLEG